MENLQEQEENRRLKQEKRYELVSKILGYVLILVIGVVIGFIHTVSARPECWEGIIINQFWMRQIWLNNSP